jgi:hypothetical protein
VNQRKNENNDSRRHEWAHGDEAGLDGLIFLKIKQEKTVGLRKDRAIKKA